MPSSSFAEVGTSHFVRGKLKNSLLLHSVSGRTPSNGFAEVGTSHFVRGKLIHCSPPRSSSTSAPSLPGSPPPPQSQSTVLLDDAPTTDVHPDAPYKRCYSALGQAVLPSLWHLSGTAWRNRKQDDPTDRRRSRVEAQ